MAASSKSNDGLSAIGPTPRTVSFADGCEVSLTPVTVGQLPLLLPLLSELAGEGDLLSLLSRNPAALTEAVVVASGVDRHWLASRPAIDLFSLAQAVVEVNEELFFHHLLPLLAARARAGVTPSPTGTPPSSPSSGPDSA
jgi:hypothetical protein